MSSVENTALRRAAVHGAAWFLIGTATTAAAQSKSPPSWGTVPQPSSPLAQPGPGQTANGTAQAIPAAGPMHPGQSPSAQRQSATSAALNTPPSSRDCRKVVTQPDPDYVTRFGKAQTNGYESGPNVDLGYLLNTTRGVGNVVQGNLNDMQVRIEQLRCENQNIEAKLDYIIRRLP